MSDTARLSEGVQRRLETRLRTRGTGFLEAEVMREAVECIVALRAERDRLAALVAKAEAWLNAEDAFAFIEEQCEMGEANGLDVARGAGRCGETREAFRAALAAGKGAT